MLHPLLAIMHGVAATRLHGRTVKNIVDVVGRGKRMSVGEQVHSWGRAYAKGAINAAGGMATAAPVRAAVIKAGMFGTGRGAAMILGSAVPGAIAAERVVTHAVRSGVKSYTGGARGSKLAKATAKGTVRGLKRDVVVARQAGRKVRDGAAAARKAAATKLRNGTQRLRSGPAKATW